MRKSQKQFIFGNNFGNKLQNRYHIIPDLKNETWEFHENFTKFTCYRWAWKACVVQKSNKKFLSKPSNIFFNRAELYGSCLRVMRTWHDDLDFWRVRDIVTVCEVSINMFVKSCFYTYVVNYTFSYQSNFYFKIQVMRLYVFCASNVVLPCRSCCEFFDPQIQSLIFHDFDVSTLVWNLDETKVFNIAFCKKNRLRLLKDMFKVNTFFDEILRALYFQWFIRNSKQIYTFRS